MLRLLLYISLPFLLFACSETVKQKEKIQVFDDIQLIDPEKGELRYYEQMVLKEGSIYHLGEKKTWESYHIIEEESFSGKYLLPPLWDMHSHLAWDDKNDSLLFPLLLSHGIMGVRDMGGDLDLLADMKKKVEEHPSFGTQLYGAGPILDGNPPVMRDFTQVLDATSDFPSILDSLRKGGLDFLKVYSLLGEKALREIAAYAKQHHLSFQGHLSEFVEPELAIRLGQKSIEHLNRLEDMAETDPKRFAELAELMKENGSWLCPTLVIYQKKAYMNDPTLENSSYQAFIPPLLKAEWKASREKRLTDKDEKVWVQAREQFEKQKAWVLALHEAGVKLLAGSDFAGMPFVYPGLGLWEELDLMKEAGIDDKSILKIACYHPIAFFGLEKEYGKLEVGKRADFLLLRKNPLEDIQHLKNIDKLYRNGIQLEKSFP